EGMREGAHKQALVPDGAFVLEPVGTAPGLVVVGDSVPPVLVLPGPPGELQPMWSAALSRLLREAPLDLDRLEITTCLRRGELEIATVFDPAAASDYAALESVVVERFGD